MLPLHQSKELTASLRSYFRATYAFRDRAVGEAFHDFIAHEGTGMFKGPYLSVKLPFARAVSQEQVPLEIQDRFTPYDHQLRAFQRLTTRDGHTPQGTILTTGTGSGKTEAFLYPLLDYCHAQRARPGIKAIILYPMNALATDQAARFARAIYGHPKLADNAVRVGLLIGTGTTDNGKDRPTTMGQDHVIEDRTNILKSPPDILLTNFKMLDYALMRARYQSLWQLNLQDPELLRFLVLDELHTYDGAQGSDVANLIRRLKLKFGFARGHLCPVGTSATVGDGEEGRGQLAEYAGRVFGETFGEGAIIGEKRVSPEDFFTETTNKLLPDFVDLETLQFGPQDSFAGYLARQRDAWQVGGRADDEATGRWIRGAALFRAIASTCGPAPVPLADVLQRLRRTHPLFGRLSGEQQEAVVFSLLSLAGSATDRAGRPLFSLQVQLWVRELSGVVRSLTEQPGFAWRLPGEVSQQEDALALPLWHCRACGGSGWLGRKPDNRPYFVSDHGKIFEAFFGYDKNIWFLNTDQENHWPLPEYKATEVERGYLDPRTLRFAKQQTEGALKVIATRKYDGHRSDHTCPLCNDRSNSISIVGGRATTIASVLTGQLLATELDRTHEADRKLLAFTNSVQDAAHQAGFIQARNYRFTFRTALQTVIGEEPAPITLARLHEKFGDHWRGTLRAKYPNHSREAYVNQFFPAKKLGRVDPQDYCHHGSYEAAFLRELDLAISWEATSEFGYNSTIGRTLEKTGTAAVTINPRLLDGIHTSLQPWLSANGMEAITPQQLRSYVTGLLLRQRQRGAVDHPFLEKYRTEGATQWNLNYNRDDRHFLNPQYGSRSRFPSPLTCVPLGKRESPLDTTYTTKDNWYTAYFKQHFFGAADAVTAINDFHQQLLPALAEAGVFDVRTGLEGTNYCLSPQAVQVGGAAGEVECSRCNVRQAVLPDDESLVGLPCITYRCPGTYERISKPASYYQAVYQRNRAPRIYATDHTGLLDRRDREDKEIDFRERPRTNSLNALVATSTLEMGIDIGDLNITMNTAVPPLPANFLQRVGRAGRKSGSALIVNLAKASQSHDLFYYEEPPEMMAGKVHTPGCFLSAREILKRHFLAFVFDSWAALDPARNVVPATLKQLGLTPDLLDDPTWVPNRIATFLDEYGAERLEVFREGYLNDEIDVDSLTSLEQYVREGLLRERLLRCFRRLIEEGATIRRHGASVEEVLASDKYGKTDDAYITLQRQKRALKAALKKLRKRQTLEQLTNYGLLPNYAFPETGVTMTAQITVKRRQQNGTPNYEPTTVEVTRPAQSAIRELVPGSVFYTQGWQVPVTGINPVDFQDTQPYRFCSRCDHLTLDLEGTAGFCPKCGDPSFHSPENRHLLTELHEVKAMASRDDATIRDNKEERDRGRQLITRHFDFSDAEGQGAFALVDIPFGVEYVKQVSLREVNAGHQQHREAGRTVEINQLQVNAAGYITCRSCGKSTTHLRKDHRRSEMKEAADYHYPYCPAREHAYGGKSDEVIKELFLLRQLNSEVLKILLPVQEFEREAHLQMFMAGINLGLRHFYGGNPQHIEMYSYPEYNRQTDRFDVYLILMDKIPGGTGYLGKLFTTDNLTRLLELAYRQIASCSCQNRGRDGCYHCIFSYNSQHFHHELSRRATEALFRKILDKCRDWRELPNGISTVANTSHIEESELEARFVRLFRTLAARPESGWALRERNRDGHIAYNLTYSSKTVEYRYVLRPQVSLGYSQGIDGATRADFLLQLIGGREDGQDLLPKELSARTQVPVYMDGWQYHASRANPRFATDVGKRCAVLKSGAYVSWTLTYEDVRSAERAMGLEDKRNEGRGHDELAGAYAVRAHAKVASHFLKNLKKGDGKDFGDLDHSFDRLRFWLERGLDRGVMQQKCHAVLGALQQDLTTDNYLPEQVSMIVARQALRSALNSQDRPNMQSYAYLDGVPSFRSPLMAAEAYVALSRVDFAYRLEVQPMEGEGYDKESWYYFWRLFNLLQLAGGSDPTYKQIGEGPAATFTLVTQPRQEAAAVTPGMRITVDTDTVTALNYYDEEYHALVRAIVAEKNWPTDILDGSFCLMVDDNRRGEVLAEAVIGSASGQVVAGPLTPRDHEVFVAHGYTVYPPDELFAHL